MACPLSSVTNTLFFIASLVWIIPAPCLLGEYGISSSPKALVSVNVSAVFIIVFLTNSTNSLPSRFIPLSFNPWTINAVAPATCGDDIDVPLIDP